MKRKAKSKVRDLTKVQVKKVRESREGNEYDYSYEYRYDWALVDSKTKKQVTLVENYHSSKGEPSLEVSNILELFGEVDLKFYKDLFTQNPQLFHKIVDLDPVIKFEVLGGQRTQQKLDRALKKMLKAQEEYDKLKRQLYKL